MLLLLMFALGTALQLTRKQFECSKLLVVSGVAFRVKSMAFNLPAWNILSVAADHRNETMRSFVTWFGSDFRQTDRLLLLRLDFRMTG